MVGAAVPLRHRGGLCHIRNPGTSQADAAVDRHVAKRLRTAGVHALCGDAGSAGAPLLRKLERLNVVFVVAASQLVQMLIVAVVTATIFLVLGLILLSPPLLAQWTNHGSSKGTLLDMTLPLPEALIQMSLFLAAVTFMYLSARAVGDGEYRSVFLDPLVEDLHTTLIARDRYRGGIAAVDAAEVSD